MICIVLGINQRYFNSSKMQQNRLVPTCRKLILKNFVIFNVIYIHFCFGPHVCIGNFSFRICDLCLGRTHKFSFQSCYYTHTHIHTVLQPHFTKNFSLHTTHSSHTIFWLLHCHKLRQTNLCLVLFLSTDLRHRFRYIIHEDESRIST